MCRKRIIKLLIAPIIGLKVGLLDPTFLEHSISKITPYLQYISIYIISNISQTIG